MFLRILVADDYELVRRGICSILKSQPGWTVCGEASTGEQAVQMARDLRPDIVIVDIGMPGLNGLDATREILRQNEDQRVLILTVNNSEGIIRAASPWAHAALP
jgi:DNA-binding NarL/FixJ family response regulator